MSTLFATTVYTQGMSTDAEDADLPLLERIETAAETFHADKARYQQSREELFDAIVDGVTKFGPSEVARRAGFTREYVARIRDGKVKRQVRD